MCQSTSDHENEKVRGEFEVEGSKGTEPVEGEMHPERTNIQGICASATIRTESSSLPQEGKGKDPCGSGVRRSRFSNVLLCNPNGFHGTGGTLGQASS